MGTALEEQVAGTLCAKGKDVAAGEAAGLAAAMIDRLRLDASRVAGLSRAVREIAEAPELLGRVEELIDFVTG